MRYTYPMKSRFRYPRFSLKRWFLFSNSVGVVLALIASQLPQAPSRYQNGYVLGVSASESIPPVRQKCVQHSSIGFVGYSPQDIPESEKQQNIGYKNNKFGLYGYSEEDFITITGDLVNSTNGDWGYMLIPYNVKDYDYDKWKKLFEQLNETHLIPVIQLWDVDFDDYREQTVEAAQFLNQFDWPIEKRYISAYNEPNDARFWKGRLDPAHYAEILSYTIDSFKSVNGNYFMMNGAFNSTAPTAGGYMDQVQFMVAMDAAEPNIFNRLDGWASHSYPQPAFRGKPWDVGRQSIRAYDWELRLLEQRFGVRELPVFITETGWPHKEGVEDNDAYYDQFTVADFMVQAFRDVWLPDERVAAVMPFTIYYDPPHDHFSWLKEHDSTETYAPFDAVRLMPKIAGAPPIITKKTAPVLTCGS